MKNYTLGKHISKINTREETSQMVKEISQEKVKKIHFYNHSQIHKWKTALSKSMYQN